MNETSQKRRTSVVYVRRLKCQYEEEQYIQFFFLPLTETCTATQEKLVMSSANSSTWTTVAERRGVGFLWAREIAFLALFQNYCVETIWSNWYFSLECIWNRSLSQLQCDLNRKAWHKWDSAWCRLNMFNIHNLWLWMGQCGLARRWRNKLRTVIWQLFPSPPCRRHRREQLFSFSE